MWMLPNLIYLRTVLFYNQLFHFTFLWNLIIILIIDLVIVIILLIFYKKASKNKQTLLTIIKSIIYFGSFIFSLLLAFGFASYYGFGYLGQTIYSKILAIIIFFVLLTMPLILIYFIVFNANKNKSRVYQSQNQGNIENNGQFMKDSLLSSVISQQSQKKKSKNELNFNLSLKTKILFAIFLILSLALSIISIIGMQRICVCASNQHYGYVIQDDWTFSTQWSRKYIDNIQKVCPQDQICHFYATLPQDSSTSVFFNAHTGININQLQVILQQISLNQKQKQQLFYSKISQNPISLNSSLIQQIGQRNIHSILFSDLQPNTTYSVTIKNNQTKKTLKITNYKTLPGFNATSIKMAIGGDVGMTKNGSILSSRLASFNPDVLFFGGDNVYDDGMRTCWYSWDNFYWIFQELDLVLNRTIPMILTVGNHDVGYDALTTVQTSYSLQQIPSYFLYNPQHYSENNNEILKISNKFVKKQQLQLSLQVPSLNKRKSVHYHIIGNTVHLNLDSGYIKSFSDQQYYIKSLALQFQAYYRFANYHNPIYPSCTDPDPDYNDVFVINNGTKYWTPQFDKFNFVAAFQHHTHHRKISKKIKNNQVNQKSGTRYVGDGSWGVNQPACQDRRITKRPQIFQHFDKGDPNHIWLVTVRNDNSTKKGWINYTAINNAGQILFSLQQQLPDVWNPNFSVQE